MATEYLEQLTKLLQKATPEKLKGVKLECKHFFGGAAVYADGRICMSLTPAGFAIKLPEESRIALLKKEGATQLRYFPPGPIKKEYVVLPNAMLKDVRNLRHWVKISVKYVLALPKSVRKRRRVRPLGQTAS